MSGEVVQTVGVAMSPVAILLRLLLLVRALPQALVLGREALLVQPEGLQFGV